MNINIFDPNLSDTYPVLVPWVNGMKQAGYTPQQIRMYYRQEIQDQMRDAALQYECQRRSDNQKQQKMQMARYIVRAYTGRVTLEQVLAMPFDRVQGLHNEIVRRLNAGEPKSAQHNSTNSKQEQFEDFKEQYDALKVQYEAMKSEYETMKLEKQTMQKHLKENIRAEYEEQIHKLQLLSGDPGKLNAMNRNELKELKQEMQKNIKKVEEAEERWMDNHLNCIICVDQRRDISFDGCDHMCVCHDCVDDLDPKRCPLCRAPFRVSRIIQF